ncbi:hypothetical protein ACGFIG_05205 [Micromonospora sp. NPDC049048]|uniref:hypothetical protein n=2 Tax=unclassified Micromonospora TaxID=2617518 RepID=UPI003718F20D
MSAHPASVIPPDRELPAAPGAARFAPGRPGYGVHMDTNTKAHLVGGPRDGSTIDTGGDALVEVELDGMMHRYVRTTKQHEDGTIYNYDGMVAPDGGEPGVEDPQARVASPKADAEGHGGKH